MKNKLWIFQVPFVVIFSIAFVVTELGSDGDLQSRFLREKLFPGLKRLSTFFVDQKFKIRGPRPPKNKIVIVEIDGQSIETLGRWPWHRDAIAYLIDKTFAAGAKAVGLDIVFSEADQRVPDDLAAILKKKNLGNLVDQFETDRQLASVIQKYRDRLVLGWATETNCQPLYDGKECPVTDPEALKLQPPEMQRFTFSEFESPVPFQPDRSAMMSLVLYLANLPAFSQAALHQGYFQAFQDPDGYIRRTSLLMMAAGRPQPSLPLELARVGLGEDLKLSLGKDQKVKSLGFAKSGKTIPVTPLGVMEINFRGPSRTFPYISALDVMSDGDRIQDNVNRKLAGLSKSELLKDAYVFIGVSALGVFDMRAFPFDSNSPGVEGHANILDNILSGDPLVPGTHGFGSVIVFLVMVAGALIYSYFMQKFEALPALGLFLGTFLATAVIDTQLLFRRNMEWNTGFFYLEILCIFVFTVAAKYVLEEQKKKFIRSAFSKYLAPTVVDSIIKDPSKLSVGGERKELTILFSDIRGFTSFSEKMDAKQLSAFLNDYLGIMTDIVFENNGTLDKYIGDAVMAFWGAPLEQPAHAANACKAARAMLQALAENKDRFKSQYGIDVNIGIGINSGTVSVGNMGSERSFEYTVIGDHVNLASRLEGLTKAYGATALTTRFTFDDIETAKTPLPPHRVLDFVKVKGKKKAVELIQLMGAEGSEEGIKAFEIARKFYSVRKWDEAIVKFEEANRLLSRGADRQDGPCQVFIERCKSFKLHPPAADWDGSWEMTSK